MTSCLLVRHAAHDLLGRILVGRGDDAPINAEGRAQAGRLADLLGARGVTRIQSSPRERALQTATPVAERLELPVQVCGALDEIDLGSWTGRSFGELAHEAEWQRWNDDRGRARAPGGESMREVEARIVSHIQGLWRRCRGGCIVMVSHADVIRAAVLHFMALPLDAWATVEVPPASVTSIRMLSPERALIDIEELAAA